MTTNFDKIITADNIEHGIKQQSIFGQLLSHITREWFNTNTKIIDIVMDYDKNHLVSLFNIRKYFYKIHIFTPLESTKKCMEMNIYLHDIDNIETHKKLLINKNGHQLMRDNNKYIDTKCISTISNIDNIGFIMIDIHAFNEETIECILTILIHDHPVILFSNCQKSTISERILNNFENIGYYHIPFTYNNERTIIIFHRDQLISKCISIATFFRIKGDNEIAFNYLNECIRASANIGNIDDNYKLFEELSIISFYINNPNAKKMGLFASDKIILSNNEIPEQSLSCVKQNLRYYVPVIETDETFMIKNIPGLIEMIKQNTNIDLEIYTLSSPSIIKYNGYYRCNIRLVNYRINDNHSYLIKDKDNTVITKNVILDFSIDENKQSIEDNAKWIDRIKIINLFELTDPNIDQRIKTNIRGMEDLRLIEGTNKFIACAKDVIGVPNPIQVWGDIVDDKITNIKAIRSKTFPNGCEKNWIPVVDDDQIKIIYNHYPVDLNIIEEDQKNKNIDILRQIALRPNTNYNLSSFRGSSPPIKFKGGWLGIIHSVTPNPPRLRFYSSRFVVYDYDFNIINFSHPFTFKNLSGSPHFITFNIGLTMLDDNHILIPFSVHDSNASMSIVNIKTIEEMLYPLCSQMLDKSFANDYFHIYKLISNSIQ